VVLVDTAVGESAALLAARAGAVAFADSRRPETLPGIVYSTVRRARRSRIQGHPPADSVPSPPTVPDTLFQMLLDAAPAFIAYVDEQERYVWVNQQYSQWFGKPRNSIIGRTVREIHGEDAYTGPIGRNAQAALRGQWSRYTTTLNDNTGRRRCIEVHCIPNRSRDGHVLGYSVLAVDLTDQHRMAEVLRRSRERYRHLLESAGSAILVLTPPEADPPRIVALNSEAARLLGMGLDQLRGRELRDLAVCASDPNWDKLRCLAAGQTIRFEPEIRGPNGSVIPVEIHAKHLVAEPEHYVLAFLHDITERKAAELRLQAGKSRLRQLLNGLFAFVASLSPEGRIEEANRTCLAGVGLDWEEMAGREVWDLPCWPDPAKARLKLEEGLRAAREGQQFRFEIEARLATGEPAILDTQLGPLHGEDGEVEHVLGFAVDITRRRKAEEALRCSEQRLRLLAENIPQVFWIRAPDGRRVDYISPACTTVWQRTPEMLQAQPECVAAAIHPEDQAKVQAALLANRQGSSTDIEYRLVRGNQAVRWVRDRGIPIHAVDGSLTCICGVAEDVTERRAMERMLRETERLAATGRMAARVAHEINNPLAGIKNAVYLLRDAVRTEHPSAQYLPMIEMEIDRISRIVAQMFELYQPRHQPARVIQVATLVARVVELCQPRARAAGAVLRFTGESPPETAMFEGPLAQILFNLINNAIDASPPQGEVTITLAINRGHLVLEVADDGPGVSPQLRDAIFEPFFTTKECAPGKGLGLGLSVSRSLAESMGGRLELVDGGSTRGAVFRLQLPPQRAKDPKSKEPAPRGEQPADDLHV
jgi:hypothetical protein